jgi:prephenate dehydrogenase
MWRDIFLANRAPAVQAIDAFIERLRSLRQAIGARDADAIAAFLRTAKARRDTWTVLRANQRPDA